MLEKTLESPLDCKEIQPVHTKGNQSWIFIGRTDAEAPILWPPDAENWLTGKDPDDPDVRKDWRQEEKQAAEDEVAGWHHRLNGHEFEQTRGDSERQGSLACCSPWSGKGSETTEQLNNNNICLRPLNILKINYSSSFLNVNLLVSQSYPTLWDPMDCSLPGSSVHGISQAGIMEWFAISFSKGFFWTRDQTWVSCIAGRFFTIWALSNPKFFSHLFI